MEKIQPHGLPDYLIEAFCLGAFMVSACLFTALLELPTSSWCRNIPNDFLRRGVIGVAMGLTAIVLIYCPWGKRSGAHMNPSVTLTFWRLGKISTRDSFFYILFQFLGGWLGVVLSAFLLGASIAHPSVAYVITVPGPKGVAIAWWAEFGISYFLMGMILMTSNNNRLASHTGIFAGILIALYVAFEAPLSGMSMNPARTLGSAIPAHVYTCLWIYFIAPPFGMLLAGELYQYGHKEGVRAKMASAK